MKSTDFFTVHVHTCVHTQIATKDVLWLPLSSGVLHVSLVSQVNHEFFGIQLVSSSGSHTPATHIVNPSSLIFNWWNKDVLRW